MSKNTEGGLMRLNVPARGTRSVVKNLRVRLQLTSILSVTVVGLNVCFHDDGAKSVLEFNSETGDYRFRRCGSNQLEIIGRRQVSAKGCSIELIDHDSATNAFSINLRCVLDLCSNLGGGEIELLPGGRIALKGTTSAGLACTCASQ